MPSSWVTGTTRFKSVDIICQIWTITGYTRSWHTGTRRLKKWLRGSPPLLSPVSSRFIFVFALSQFSGPDYLGAWNRLHLDESSPIVVISSAWYLIVWLYNFFKKIWWGRYSPRYHVTTASGPVMLLQSRVNKIMCLLKSIPTCDEPLSSGQSPLSGHFPVPRGWPLNGGSTVQWCPDRLNRLYKLKVSADKKKCKVSEIAARKNFIRLRKGPTVT